MYDFPFLTIIYIHSSSNIYLSYKLSYSPCKVYTMHSTYYVQYTLSNIKKSNLLSAKTRTHCSSAVHAGLFSHQSFRSITDTGQESLASIAVLSYSGATCAYASATPLSSNRNTSGHAATHAPHEIHPSFTIAFTDHSSLHFLLMQYSLFCEIYPLSDEICPDSFFFLW